MSISPTIDELRNRLFPVVTDASSTVPDAGIDEQNEPEFVDQESNELIAQDPGAVEQFLGSFLSNLTQWELEAEKLADVPIERAGNIVRLSDLDHPDLGVGRARLPIPVYVLLNERLHEVNGGKVWRGWLVTGERDYANHYDLIINSTAFREGCCQIVQCWNEVLIYAPSISEVAGTVDGKTLDAARAVALSFGALDDPADVPKHGAAGVVLNRVINGEWQETGSWLNDTESTDPRNDYVHLYAEFASRVNLAAHSYIAANRPNVASEPIVAIATGVLAHAHSASPWARRRRRTIATGFSLSKARYAAADGLRTEKIQADDGVEYIEISVDRDGKTIRISPAFTPSECRHYKISVRDADDVEIAELPSEEDGYLGEGKYQWDFSELCEALSPTSTFLLVMIEDKS